MIKKIFLPLYIVLSINNLSAFTLDGSKLIPGSQVTASALEVGRIAMETVAENIANQYTTKDADGKAYKAKHLILESIGDGDSRELKVKKIEKDERKGEMLYMPEHVHANGEGYVEQSNVKISDEMVKMMQYSRWMEAQYVVANASVKMVQSALLLGK